MQRLSGGAGPLPGAAHQHDVLVEVPDDLIPVLLQQIQRNVVSAWDVGGFELGGGADVDEPGAGAGLCELVQRGGIDGRRGGHQARPFNMRFQYMAGSPYFLRYQYGRCGLTGSSTGKEGLSAKS